MLRYLTHPPFLSVSISVGLLYVLWEWGAYVWEIGINLRKQIWYLFFHFLFRALLSQRTCRTCATLSKTYLRKPTIAPPSPFLSLDKEKGKNHIIKCLFVFDLVDIYTFQVLKESFKIYCAVNDGIINLVDKVNLLII